MTEKQRIFAENYACNLNATKSYKIAYPSASDKCANKQGFELLKNEEIKQYISELQEEAKGKVVADVKWVLNKLVNIANNDTETTTNKLKALELLGKHLGMFKETNMNVNMNYEEYLKRVDGDEY